MARRASRGIFGVGAVVLVGSVFLGGMAFGNSLTTSGTVHKFFATSAFGDTGATGQAYACTSNTSYEVMPQTTVKFDVSGTANRRVVVMFQGEWAGGDLGPGVAVIRLSVDGVVQPGPGQDLVSEFATHSGQVPLYSTAGFNFVTQPQKPGSHMATIEWRSQGGSICIDELSVIVLA